MKHWCRFVQSIFPAKARGLAVLCVLLFVGSFAFAQEATVVGTITDPSGSVLPNVAVTITSSDTGQVHT
ncbi:MAG: carboxypeptidase-like regulatory domain-containing protein, partial [Candidatus Angelobacter sp.]